MPSNNVEAGFIPILVY